MLAWLPRSTFGSSVRSVIQSRPRVRQQSRRRGNIIRNSGALLLYVLSVHPALWVLTAVNPEKCVLYRRNCCCLLCVVRLDCAVVLVLIVLLAPLEGKIETSPTEPGNTFGAPTPAPPPTHLPPLSPPYRWTILPPKPAHCTAMHTKISKPRHEYNLACAPPPPALCGS